MRNSLILSVDQPGLEPPDYESTGVMMNTLPSWTGENWTLNVGITGIYTGFLNLCFN